MAEAKLIDGKANAAGLRQRVAAGVAELVAKGGPTPGLATVLVGGDPASQVYVRSKGKMAAELGMASFDHRLPAETSEAELLALIARLNADDSVHGILVQLPLPKHIDTAHVLLARRSGQGRRRLPSLQCRPAGLGRARRAARLSRALHAARRLDAAARCAGLARRPPTPW